MKEVKIRNISDSLHAQLIQAAKVEDMSMQEYLLWMMQQMVGSEWTLLESLEDCEDALEDTRTRVYAIRAARGVTH